jgi:hypothetical protein
MLGRNASSETITLSHFVRFRMLWQSKADDVPEEQEVLPENRPTHLARLAAADGKPF